MAKPLACPWLGHRVVPPQPSRDCDLAARGQPCGQAIGMPTAWPTVTWPWGANPVAKPLACPWLGHRARPPWPSHNPRDCDLAAGGQPCGQVVGMPMAWPWG
jgi:hypothetical protein